MKKANNLMLFMKSLKREERPENEALKNIDREGELNEKVSEKTCEKQWK